MGVELKYLDTNSLASEIFEALESDDKSSLPGGFTVVLDSHKKVIGVISDSDLRKYFAKNENQTNSLTVKKVMQSNFLYLYKDELENRDFSKISNLTEIRSFKNKSLVQFIPILNRDNTLNKILHITDIIESWDEFESEIVIIGLGFVGLTLALAMIEKGKSIFGVDENKEHLELIKSYAPGIHEPYLDLILENSLNKSLFLFNSINAIPRKSLKSRIYIVCVGSPVKNEEIDSQYLLKCFVDISKTIKKGDTVILRSTVPIGTTRELALKISDFTGFTTGLDFYFGYAPERTVEGNAIEECFSIPQLYSGITTQCTLRIGKFFEKLASSRIRCESVEACEMGKLISNSFRDVIFSFSNEMASFASNFNIDINRLINEVNSGYARNQIKHPSPGVSGPCLSKDSYILNRVVKSNNSLIYTARKINESLPKKIGEQLLSIANESNIKKVLILGLAFKGYPETNDIRNSSNIEIAKFLSKSGLDLKVHDNVVKAKEISGLGLNLFNKDENWKPEILCILNNHLDNFSFFKNLISNISEIFLYDPWYLCSTIYDNIKIKKIITMSSITNK